MTSWRSARGERIAQGAFLAGLTVYLIILALELPELSKGARLFPAIILVASAVFVALKALSTFNTRAARYLEPELGSIKREVGPGEDRGSQAVPRSDPVAARHPWFPVAAWLWVTGAVAAMYAFGFLAGIGVSVLVYMRTLGGDGWRVSLFVAGITTLFAYLVFVRAMHIELDFGLMNTLL